MKAFEIREFGIENLVIADRPEPEPGPGQVLVRMRAASLNFRDLMMVKGVYNPKLRRPMVPLSDGAGTVQAVGPGVTRWKPGDRVCGIFMQSWVEGPYTRDKGSSALGGAIDGVLAESVVFDQAGLVAAPAHLSDEAAATLPCAAVTAWNALFEHTPPRPGDTVLLQGTGGVSVFALQLARAAGLQVIITSSSDEKLARARDLGASAVINYRTTPDWDAEARKLTSGQGVDHVIEVGGSGTLARSLKSLRPAGVVSIIGVLSGVAASFDITNVLMNAVRLQGIYVGSRLMFERLNAALTLHSIQPVIDKLFPWTEYPAALQHMESASHFGKIVLRF